MNNPDLLIIMDPPAKGVVSRLFIIIHRGCWFCRVFTVSGPSWGLPGGGRLFYRLGTPAKVWMLVFVDEKSKKMSLCIMENQTKKQGRKNSWQNSWRNFGSALLLVSWIFATLLSGLHYYH